MKLRTKKLIADVITELVFIVVVAALVFYLIEKAVDGKCASECGDCKSTYDWCPGYWEEKNICQGER